MTAMDKSIDGREESVATIAIDELLRMPCLNANDIATGKTFCIMTVNGFDFDGIESLSSIDCSRTPSVP